MKVAILSGKGGTGKSTVAANLAYSLSLQRDVTAVDCDVEEPNLRIFFSPGGEEEKSVMTPVPMVDRDRCTLCGDCARFCRYGALVMGLNGPMLNQVMCHSCGGCVIVCPEDAISEIDREIGKISVTRPLPRLTLVTGILNEGEVMAPPVIAEAKDTADPDALTLLDSSPGIACPVIETLEGVDAAVLVTESTPFGLHDLELAADVVIGMGIPAGVVINRSDGQDQEVKDFCASRSLPILMTIPFERGIAQVQNRGKLIAEADPAWAERFLGLYDRILPLLEASA